MTPDRPHRRRRRTGKTTVITRRIATSFDQGKARPEEILALTFTDKAAAEMEARVDELVPYGYADVEIATFMPSATRCCAGTRWRSGCRTTSVC